VVSFQSEVARLLQRLKSPKYLHHVLVNSFGWENRWVKLCAGSGSDQGKECNDVAYQVWWVRPELLVAGIVAQAKGAKAKARPLALYITSALCGKLGDRAALIDKWIMKVEEEVDPYWFEEGKMEAEEWEVLFIMKDKMAKQRIAFHEKDE
jgi:hypothetical protein